MVCVAYGILVERRWYRLVRHRFDILPASGPATLTVLHLSDLHFLAGERGKARFLASLPPADVAIVTGDFLAEPEAVESVVEALRPVRGRLASWFVLGSNDYFTPIPLNYFAYFRRHRRSRRAPAGRAGDLVGSSGPTAGSDLTNDRRETSLDGLRGRAARARRCAYRLAGLSGRTPAAPSGSGWR